MGIVRAQLVGPSLALTVLVWPGLQGCRSTTPVTALTPAVQPTPAVTPTPTPLPTVPPSEAAPPKPPEPLLEARPSSEPPQAGGEAAAAAETEVEEAEQEKPQKQALDLCESAAQLLKEGHREQAIRIVDRAYGQLLLLPDNGDDAALQAKDDIRQLIAKLLRDAYQRSVTPPGPSWDLGLPIIDNEHVRREIKSFTTVERDFFLEGYRRSGLYRPMILAKLEAARMPSQLSWLPLVESWFKVRALSRAGAVGPWQFIASTGLRYGITRDGWVDERMDPEKSTDAAIAFLADLHASFGDWPKALAAYNCGQGRVLGVQGRAGDQYMDFWDLYEQLPQETRRYVPRLVAALQIIQNPAQYGMTLPEPLAPPKKVATLKSARAVALADLEQALGLSKDAIVALNPELRFAATPNRDYSLRLPAEHVEAASVKLAELPEWKPPRPLYVTHRVHGGQTLGSIARQYHTTVGAIQRANGLRNARRLRVGQRLRIPLHTR